MRAEDAGNFPFDGLGPIECAGEKIARTGFEVDLLHREISSIGPAVNDRIERVAIWFREKTDRYLQVLLDPSGALGPLLP